MSAQPRRLDIKTACTKTACTPASAVATSLATD